MQVTQKEIESPLLSRRQAAKYLNVSIATLDRYNIPRVKLFNKTVMFEKKVLDELIGQYRIPAKKEKVTHD